MSRTAAEKEIEDRNLRIRAAQAQKALQIYTGMVGGTLDNPEDERDAVQDLLTAIECYCDVKGLVFDTIAEDAQAAFIGDPTFDVSPLDGTPIEM